MTVTTTSNKVVAAGNGATTVFSYSFIIPSASDAEVIYTDTTGTETVLSQSQYTITGVNNTNGGTVTYPLSGSPIASGTSLTIARIVPYTQEVVIDNQGAFYPAVVEGSLDSLEYQIQQLAENDARSLKQPISDAAAIGNIPGKAQRANTLLGFDSNGNPIASTGSGSGGVISAAMAPVVSAATLAAGRTNMGVVGTSDSDASGFGFVTNDTTLSADSASLVPSEHAVKGYAQPILTAGTITTSLLADGSVTDVKVNASGISAAKSNYTPTGTAGQVATRSVIQVLEDYSNSIVNYKDGSGNTPVANGTTDVSTAVTRCLGSNTVAFVPPSSSGYRINAAISLGSGQSIVGVPGRSKIIHGGTADLFSIAGDDVSISGLFVDAANNTGGYTFAVDTTATRQRLTIDNNYIINAKGGIKDANSTGQLITLDLLRTRWRYHQGPGVNFNDAYAFINLEDVYVDYLNNATAQNFTAYFFFGNQGLNLRNVEVSGSIGSITGTTTAQKGLVLNSCQAVKAWRFFGDSCGGAGMSIDSGSYMEFSDCSLSLCDNGQLVTTNSNTKIGFANCYFGGRQGIAGATVSKDNINLSSGTVLARFGNCGSFSATGHGLNNAGANNSWVGGNLYGNNSRGVNTSAGSSLHVANTEIVSNTAGNYNLATTLDQLTACRLNSGGIFTGAGPITG